MSVSDIIIGIVNSIIGAFASILPAEFSGFPLTSFNSYFLGVAQNMSYAYNSIDWLVPAWLVISVFGIIILAEILLLGYKAGLTIINVIRGSGA